MIRTGGKPLLIDSFAGLTDAIDHVRMPNNMTSWAEGGFFSERNLFERLGGKQLNGTSTNIGRILSITQLRFSGSNVVVVHSSNAYIGGMDMTVFVSSTTSTLPFMPFIRE